MTIFKEQQHLMPAIRWLIASVAGGAILLGIVLGLIGENNSEESIIPLVVSGLIGCLAMALIWITRLDVRMDRKGITHRLIPLEWKDRFIAKEEIASMEILKFRWIPRFGGFGKRRRIFRKQVAYIMNNKWGLLIKMKNGRSVVLSIKNEKHLRQFLRTSYEDLQIINL